MDSTKGTLGHLMSNSCVLHPVGSAGHVVNSGAPAARNINALFFMLVWDRYRFHKKHTWTHHAVLVFLHLVESAGHVVHSGAFRA
jgi:hypothetical protein